MAQQQPYIYNRGQAIRQDMGKAADNIGQGFQNLIDYKKNEYDFINKQFQDVELIKKDLNMYNNDIITKRSDELLKDTANAIKENGKLDFKKIGEIKKRTMDLATAKRNSEMTVKAYDEVIKLMKENAPNMIDVMGTHSKITNLLKDEKNLFSPKDLYKEAMNTYRDGINYSKLFKGRIDAMNDKGSEFMSEPFLTKSGDKVTVSGKLAPGFKYNQATGKVEQQITDDGNGNKSYPMDELISSIASPEEMEGYQKQIVGHGIMFSDLKSHLSESLTSILNSGLKYKTIATAEDLAKKAAETKVANEKLKGLQYVNSEENRQFEKNLKEQEAKNSTTRANAAVLGANASVMNASTNSAEYKAKLAGGGFNANASIENPNSGAILPNSDGSVSTEIKDGTKTYEKFFKNRGGTYNVYTKGSKIPKNITENEFKAIMNKGDVRQSKALQNMMNPIKSSGGTKTMTNTENL